MSQVVEFFEIKVPYCGNVYGVSPCRARIASDNDPVAARFDGASYLKRAGGLTGAADSKSFTFSCWARIADGVGGNLLVAVTALDGNTVRTYLSFSPIDNRFTVGAYNAAGTLILDHRSSVVPTGPFVHLLASYDLSNPARAHIYINDVSDIAQSFTFTDDTIDFTMSDWGVGGAPGGNGKLDGALADLWFAPGVYLDLSVESNRRKFIDASGNPVSLGATGNTPTGTSPLTFMSGEISTWHTNDGTGGGFTLTGTLAADDFGTGTAKCFQCLSTCQDTENFAEETRTLRFAKPADYLPRDIDIVGPWIGSIDFTAATVSLGENLGTRAVLKVRIEDHPHSDAGEGLDPYQAARGYDPFERGSFWPRFVARYPSLDGAECAWIIGEAGQALADMERRTFYIEGSASGDGAVTLTAKDPVTFLGGGKAQIPVLSEGFLSAGISSSATSFTISPTGAGDDYGASGYIRIAGKEDCSFTRSGDAFTIVRAALGTTAASHASGDRVQLVKRYASVAAADIIENAITGYTDMPAGLIPLAEWQLEDSTNLGTLYTFTLGEPVAVDAFVSRVLEQCGAMLWYDDLANELRFRVIKSIPPAAEIVSEANVVNKTFEMTAQPEQRVSRAWVYYGINDPTKRRDDLDNYRQAAKRPDEVTALASERLYGSQSLRKIFADGIAIGGGSVAQRVGNLLVGRKQRPPRRFKWSMLRGQSLPDLGGGYYLDWRSLQDASGAREQVPVQIISVRPAGAIFQFVAEEMRFTDLDVGSSTDRVLLINFEAYNLNLRAVHDLTYPSTFDGVTVRFLISSTVGSTSTAVPAIVVGDWPVGFVPVVELTGRIQGKGGRGGNGGTWPAPGGAGAAGGTALYTRHPIDLDLSSGGEIWAGGGGGGGGSPSFDGGGDHGGAPGGGGAGKTGGDPGSIGTGFNSSSSAAQAGTDAAGGSPGSRGFFLAGFGGAGGGPGLPGAAGGPASLAGGAAGPAGAAIDGVSYCSITGTGDRRGGQIN